MSKFFAVSRAFGRGDWRKIIELEEAELDEAEHKQHSYIMIGFAYENLSDLENAKDNYGKALEIDECEGGALEGLARVYYKEKDYGNTYYYVIRGLHSIEEIDYSIPKFVKLLMAVIIKIFRPTRSFKSILDKTKGMDQTREKWIKWALEFKEWYEKNIETKDEPKVH